MAVIAIFVLLVSIIERICMYYKSLLLAAAVVCTSCVTRPLVSPNGRVSADVDGPTINVYYNDPGNGKVRVTDVHMGLVTAGDPEQDPA